jgi:hypothetical protein
MIRKENTNNDNVSLKKSIFNELKIKLSNSTFHGLPKIVKNESLIIRIFWILLIITSLLLCLYLLISSIINYHKHDVTLSMKNIEELPTTFPAVTICNINAFNEVYAKNFIEDNVPFARCFYHSNKSEFNECFNSTSKKNVFNGFLGEARRIIASKNLTQNERKKLGFDIKEMLVSCQYNREPCDASNFTWYWNNRYGNCYTFNKGDQNTPLLKTSLTGDLNGLELELTCGMTEINIYISNSPLILLIFKFHQINR